MSVALRIEDSIGSIMTNLGKMSLVKSHFTYADYLKYDGPDRFELLYGESFMMAAPSTAHQAIIVELSRQIGNFLLGKPCKVFVAPLDVRLFPLENNEDDTVVQPDVLVICDKKKISKQSVNGAPELAIEILSPATAKKYLAMKRQAYREAGVKEYWEIDPDAKTVTVQLDGNNNLETVVYSGGDIIKIRTLPGLSIDLKTLWAVM